MNRYRIEIQSNRAGEEATSLMAPDIPTALIIAEINMKGGSAALYEGDRQLADLQRQPGTRAAYWRVA